ncbi:MAG: amino acid ABC transporter permease [Candidatus Thermoplasmatota archaeon]|nr:amino acid ABC transporter permease [Candidatus Thermoplasmatota archaeon]
MTTHRALTAAVFAFTVMALFFLFLYVLTINGEFNAQFVLDHLPDFFLGVQLTLILTAGSFSIGILIGFLTAAARVSRSRILRAIAKGYVDVFRGTPILVQILLWLVVIQALIPTYRFFSLVAGFLALTINTGAYQAEIFRGGLKAIHEGQLEAGRALGFTPWQLMRHIRLPQTLRLIIPPMTNEFILLLKSSALLSAIGIVETAFVATQLSVGFAHPLEAWTAATLLYLAMTVPLSKIIQYAETKFRIPGLGLPVVRAGIARPPPPAASADTGATQAVSARRTNGLYLYLQKRMKATWG